MKLTQKLLGFLNRVFDKDPVPFIALRISYDGDMSWTIAEGVLSTVVSGGIGVGLSINLSQYSLAGLADFVAAQPGYSVTYVDGTEKAAMSALVLLDGAGDQAHSNGDRIFGYTSLLYSYMEANAVELGLAEAQISEMLNQLNVNTGAGEWLDLIGGYYGVFRSTITSAGVSIPEPDTIYGPRIIQEVLRPRGNNIALEMAISNATGGLPSKVVDAPLYSASFPQHDSSISHDGTHTYSSTSKLSYNLFDVQYAFDLEGAEDIALFASRVMETIEKFRDAGTHLHSIALKSSPLLDSVLTATDSITGFSSALTMSDVGTAQTETVSITTAFAASFSDAQPAGTDSGISETISYSTKFNGLRSFNGMVPFASGGSLSESV